MADANAARDWRNRSDVRASRVRDLAAQVPRDLPQDAHRQQADLVTVVAVFVNRHLGCPEEGFLPLRDGGHQPGGRHLAQPQES